MYANQFAADRGFKPGSMTLALAMTALPIVGLIVTTQADKIARVVRPPIDIFDIKPPKDPPPDPKPPTAIDLTPDRRDAVEAPSYGCVNAATGTVGSAPSAVSPLGVQGTTTDDLVTFALAYNAKRAANCLKPVPLGNFRYDSCMEQRLFWMAEDPSLDPSSAWGHIGTQRSDGVPSVGCDGNLAGGMSNTGATVAVKWWDSTAHRTALYKPTYTGSTANVCIYFAMTHGGIPNEPYAFTRAAARWAGC